MNFKLISSLLLALNIALLGILIYCTSNPKTYMKKINTKIETNRFKDKVILITGGTSGIGLATAVQFAKNGAKSIIVCGRNEYKWKLAQSYITSKLTSEQSNKIQYYACDVRVELQVKNMIENIFKKFGQLDVCFNNAGVQPGEITLGGDITKMEFESLIANDGSILYKLPSPQPSSACLKTKSCIPCIPSQNTTASPYCENPLATSIFGIFYCLKWEIEYVFKYQPKNLPVAIINTSSRNGVLPDPHRPLYAGSKAFIISITKSLANQVAQKVVKESRASIRINSISPGPVDTPLERAAFPGSDEQFNKSAVIGVPMQRVAKAEEIAPVVLFLADYDNSSYITASNIPVDGGDVGSPLIQS